jgi:hypothetical protein
MQMQKRLNACCKCLLEAQDIRSPPLVSEIMLSDDDEDDS